MVTEPHPRGNFLAVYGGICGASVVDRDSEHFDVGLGRHFARAIKVMSCPLWEFPSISKEESPKGMPYSGAFGRMARSLAAMRGVCHTYAQASPQGHRHCRHTTHGAFGGW